MKTITKLFAIHCSSECWMSWKRNAKNLKEKRKTFDIKMDFVLSFISRFPFQKCVRSSSSSSYGAIDMVDVEYWHSQIMTTKRMKRNIFRYFYFIIYLHFICRSVSLILLYIRSLIWWLWLTLKKLHDENYQNNPTWKAHWNVREKSYIELNFPLFPFPQNKWIVFFPKRKPSLLRLVQSPGYISNIQHPSLQIILIHLIESCGTPTTIDHKKKMKSIKYGWKGNRIKSTSLVLAHHMNLWLASGISIFLS